MEDKNPEVNLAATTALPLMFQLKETINGFVVSMVLECVGMLGAVICDQYNRDREELIAIVRRTKTTEQPKGTAAEVFGAEAEGPIRG